MIALRELSVEVIYPLAMIIVYPWDIGVWQSYWRIFNSLDTLVILAIGATNSHFAGSWISNAMGIQISWCWVYISELRESLQLLSNILFFAMIEVKRFGIIEVIKRCQCVSHFSFLIAWVFHPILEVWLCTSCFVIEDLLTLLVRKLIHHLLYP